MLTAINNIIDCLNYTLEIPAISHSNKLESCRKIYYCPLSMTVHNMMEIVTALCFLYCI